MIDILKCIDFVNKMCFKITLAVFFSPSNFSCSSQNSKEVFAWHSIVFLLFYLADHQNCIKRTAILCHILYVLLLSILEIWDMASFWLSLSCK